MEIRKSDNSLEDYSKDKVKNVICEAYFSAGEECEEHLIDSIVNNLFVYDGMSTDEIRRQVEYALMSINKKVAKAFLENNSERTARNKTIKKTDDFISNYFKASNAATGSKYDSNANVSNKNVVTMGQELPKSRNIEQNRYMITDRLRKKYGKKLAKQYITDLESHVLYKHDETAIPGMPYCVAITMYPFLVDGLTKLGGQSVAPSDLKSFCGEFINLVYSVSSQFAGAVATPEFLMYMDYFIRKDYGENYLGLLNEVVELNRKGRTLEQVIENYFQQVVHSMNMPAGNRGYQTVFWNVGYFDKNYFEGVFGDFVFPDGSKPKWETLSWLQKKFMNWFNEERTKYVLTFPVETMALLSDGEDIVDEEYGNFTAEMWSKGASFFCYISDSPDSLSSCCFSKDQKVLWKSSTNGVQLTTLEELHNTKWEPDKKNLKIFHNGSWVPGKSIKLPNRKMFRVITENNKEFIMTDNHINVTLNGEKSTNELTINDYLMFNTMPLHPVNENDEKLTYEQGFIVGVFLGDGSFGGRSENGTIYEVNFSQNEKKYEKCMEMVDIANRQIGGENVSHLTSVYNNVYPVRICSKKMVSFIQKWTNWKEKTYSYNKELNLDCLLQSIEFRRGILDGWYNTDGGNSNRCYTTSKKLVECMEALVTSLGMQSIIDVSERTDEKVVIRSVEYNRQYPLYCLRWYEQGNHRFNKDSEHTWIKKNNSIYFKIKSIEEIEYLDNVYCIECRNEEEPYFTLPSGLITHNCRLRNSLKDNVDTEHNHTTHQFSMGTASVATGSKSVMTVNLNRLIQEAVNRYAHSKGEDIPKGAAYPLQGTELSESYEFIKEDLSELIERVHKYQAAFNDIIKEFYENNMLDVYSAGFIDMKKQYLTIGVNGLTDAAEFLGIEISDNETYNGFVNLILETINKLNRKNRTRELMYNTEFVPKLTGHVKPLLIDLELPQGQ